MGATPEPKDAAPAGAEATLQVAHPDGRVQLLRIAGRSWSLGRADDNDFPLPEDAGISRRHLILEHDGRGWTLRDAGSTNGTFLNGKQIREVVRLQPDDLITASRICVRFNPRKPLPATCSLHFDAQKTIGDFKNPFSTTLVSLLSGDAAAQKTYPGAVPLAWRNPLDLFRRAGRELSLSRPLADLFQVVLDLAMEAVGAERGVLLTKEESGLSIRASRGDDFRISSTVRDRVLEDRSSLLLQDVLQDETFRAVDSVVSQHIRSLMAVPLQTDERVLGMIYVDASHPSRHFVREDLELLTVVANVAAIRIERQRLTAIEAAQRHLADELAQAAEIQRQFLPAGAPEVPGMELAGCNVPCRAVGGDYYDYLRYPDGRVGILIGDVCGKGLPAALLMMGFQARVQVLAEECDSPAEFVRRLNRGLTAGQTGNRFVSSFFALVDPSSGLLRYCNAGHNPPFLLRAGGEVERLDKGGPVLGIRADASYEEGASQLGLLDILFLFSDGLSEAANPEEKEFGENRLLDLLRQNSRSSAKDISSRIIDAAQRWMAGASALDDITVLVARRTDIAPKEAGG